MLKVEVGVRVKFALKVAGGLWPQLIFDGCSMLHGQTFCVHSLYILKQVGALRCVRMVVVCGKFSKNNDRLSQKWHKFVCLMRHRVLCLVVNIRIGDKQTAYNFAVCLSPIALNVMQFHDF